MTHYSWAIQRPTNQNNSKSPANQNNSKFEETCRFVLPSVTDALAEGILQRWNGHYRHWGRPATVKAALQRVPVRLGYVWATKALSPSSIA